MENQSLSEAARGIPYFTSERIADGSWMITMEEGGAGSAHEALAWLASPWARGMGIYFALQKWPGGLRNPLQTLTD